MKRALFLLLVGLGIGLGGCAADVEDPVAPPPVAEEQRDPPEQALNTELRDPLALLLAGAAIDRPLDHVRTNKTLPMPGPIPER